MSGSKYTASVNKFFSATIVLVIICVFLHKPSIAKEVTSVKANSQVRHSVPTQIVMKKLLLEIGFTEDNMPDIGPDNNPDNLPDDNRPKPGPVDPNNKPVKPKVDPNKQDDSFFDDDFFDDSSIDGKSFDEMKKEMEKEFADTTAAWQKQYEETVAKWATAKEEYNSNIDKVAASTFDIESEMKNAPILQNTISAGESFATQSMAPGEFHLIPKSLDIKIKNQAFRPTCAAFTGVRALETVLMQNNIPSDFSEQHFYWMSKSKCQKQACSDSEGGSSFIAGLAATQRSKVGVLTESDCAYNIFQDKTNETQTPLNHCNAKPGVSAGKAVVDLSLSQVVQQIHTNNPVMAGIKLSDNFYHDGFVGLGNIGKYDNKTDRHAGGHAVLLVGYIALPSDLNEGKYCLVTANSWGDGWGVGGYGCLSERYLARQKIVFASLKSVILTEAFKERYKI